MGTVVHKNQPCIDPECGSSDAMQIFEAGDAFCFSCHEPFTKAQVEKRGIVEPVVKEKTEKRDWITIDEILGLPIRGIRERGIPKDIMEFFGIRVSYGGNGEIDKHYYPYGDGYNIRNVADKTFSRVGKFTKLCGQEQFTGGGKRLVITEGELDMASVAYASKMRYDGTIYPVCTMGSSANVGLLTEHRDWIRSFDEVVLWFDNDEAGKDATEKAIKIIGFAKCKIARHPTCKDASDVMKAETYKGVMKPIFDAESVIPGGIITRAALKERMRLLASISALPYPACMAGVNSKLKGMRTGEITLFTSGTGSGKSTLLREIILHIKNTTDEKIGICALEESPEAEARRMSGMQICRNTANEEMTFEELEVGFDELYGKDDEEERIIMLDHQGSITDSSIIDKIEYMCLMGCKYILIDHITILVSEGIDKLQGNEAQDKIMNDLLSIVKRYPVWIGLVSHLRKVGQGAVSFEEGKLPTMDDIKGSGSIKQISFDIIAFARNMNAEEEEVRNLIKMAVLKARTTGLTGPVRGAIYNHDTSRLAAAEEGADTAGENFTIEQTWVKTN